MLGEPFAGWIATVIERRNDDLAAKQNLLIEMDPVIAAAFHKSVNISSKTLTSSFSPCLLR